MVSWDEDAAANIEQALGVRPPQTLRVALDRARPFVWNVSEARLRRLVLAWYKDRGLPKPL